MEHDVAYGIESNTIYVSVCGLCLEYMGGYGMVWYGMVLYVGCILVCMLGMWVCDPICSSPPHV